MANTAFSAVITISGTSNQLVVSGTAINPIMAIANNPVLPGVGSVTLPQGTTAQRSGGAGAIRFNSQTTELEATLDGATWVTLATTGGVVLSVSGTTNRITSTGGANPVIDISAAYVGQTSLTTLGIVTSGTWSATTIATTHGGTGLTSYVLGDLIYSSAANVLSTLAGNTTSGIQYLSQTGTGVVSAAPVWATISGGDITGAALTKTDDTNVTMTLGGTPTTALLRAASMTLGWTGQLGLTRGGTAASLTADFGGIVYSTASALAILASTSTARQIIMSGASTTPAWSTATYPATTTVSQLLYSSSANVIAGLATANSAALVTTVGGVPIFSSSLSDGQIIIGVSGGTPVAASLSAGSGVTITPGAGTISIAATGSGGTVTSVSGTANQIDSTGGNTPVLSLSSTVIFPGTVTLHADPVSALQAVTKQYADAIAAGLEFKNACVCASTVALTVTYNNNASGVGATLTNADTQAAFSVDGQSPTLGQRVLIKNQASTVQNGIYTVTVVGTGATNWVLTRSLDFDQPSEIAPGDLVPVTAGTVNVDTLWLQTQTVATIGTDAIVFSQFSSAPLTLPVSLANGGTNANLTASNGGIFYSTASAGAILSGTATAQQLLMSGASTAPIWSTSTYPTTNAINTLLYASSANVMAALATANSSVLVTSSGGVPSLSTTLPSGLSATNLTLTTPALGTPSAGVLTNCTGLPVAGGGTGNSTFTAYSVICAGTTATGAFQNVSGLGSSGNVLTSNGASALPTWQAPGAGSGSWALLASNTPSGVSTSDFVSIFTSSYDVYFIELLSILPATDGAVFELQLGTAGPSYNTTTNNWAELTYRSAVADSSQGNTNVTANLLTTDVSTVGVKNSGAGASGGIFLYGLNGSSLAPFGTFNIAFFSSGNSLLQSVHGSLWQGTAAVYTSLRFLFSSGNITSGTIRVYGIKNS